MIRLLARLTGLLAAMLALGASAQTLEVRPDLAKLFGDRPGCFALFDAGARRMLVVDSARAQRRYRPASTFKVANSLIALETAAVSDVDEIIPYGGGLQPFKAWERDLPMREAIVASSVPVYQEIARRIGLPRMRQQLTRLGYGNMQTGEVVDRFWLDGPLQISAVEQARFLARLAQGQLPASKRSQQLVREILRLEHEGPAALYGKTGWAFAGRPDIGWWVGWIERDGRIHSFALNIDLRGEQDLGLRREIGEALLRKLELL